MARAKVTAFNHLAGILLDRDSPVPLYFQLAQHLEAQIRQGSLAVGDRLENELKIAEDLGLSRPTVRAAFRYLVDKGLVLRRRGQGTIVMEEKVNRPVKLTSLFDDLSDVGRKPTTQVLHNEVIKPSDMVREALQLDVGEFVIYLERLRLIGGEPIALMHNYIPTSLVTLNTEMLEDHGLYELLRAAGIFPEQATQRMSAKNASTQEARLLEETKGIALLTMERTTYDDKGRAIEFAQHVYRASRYALSSTVTASHDSSGHSGLVAIDGSY